MRFRIGGTQISLGRQSTAGAPPEEGRRQFSLGLLRVERTPRTTAGDGRPPRAALPPAIQVTLQPLLPFNADEMLAAVDQRTNAPTTVPTTRPGNETLAAMNAARQAEQRRQAAQFVEQRRQDDIRRMQEAVAQEQLLDEVTRQLDALPATRAAWTHTHRERAVRQLFRLLPGFERMASATRAKADDLLRGHLDMMLSAVDETTRTRDKDPLVAYALRMLADIGVPFADKAGVIHRLMEKRELLRSQIRRPDKGQAPALLRQQAIPLLRVYRDELERLRAANLQPVVPAWDNLLLPLLLEAQNARTPGLDAKLLAHDQLVRLVHKNRHSDASAIGILDFGPVGSYGSGHHCAFRACTSSTQRPVITLVDSIHDPTQALSDLELQDLPTGSRLVPVRLGVQNAQECMIFALSTVKKIADHPDDVDRLGRQGPWTHRLGVQVHAPIVGANELPLGFFKHSQSMRTLDDLAQAGRYDAHNAHVNKIGKPETGQTIFQRWEAHRVDRQRPDNPQVVATYSASIESKRRLFVDQAIDHFSRNP